MLVRFTIFASGLVETKFVVFGAPAHQDLTRARKDQRVKGPSCELSHLLIDESGHLSRLRVVQLIGADDAQFTVLSRTPTEAHPAASDSESCAHPGVELVDLHRLLLNQHLRR